MRADAAFEIAVSRQHGGTHQIALLKCGDDVVVQWPGISDAGGAAETDHIKAKFVEMFLQPGFFEIVGNDL